MRAKRSTRVHPWATIDIRQVLRQFGPVARDLPSVMAAFRVDDQEAQRILTQLSREGFVRRDPASAEAVRWCRTPLGDAHAGVGGRPLSRVRAARLLQGALRRVAEINRKPHYLCRVTAVGVFGAYLTDAPFLDVLDLVVRIVPKPPAPGTAHTIFRPDRALPYWRLQKLLPPEEWPHWREHHVEWFLVGGTPHVVLHRCDDPLLRGQRVRLIYAENPPMHTVRDDNTLAD